MLRKIFSKNPSFRRYFNFVYFQLSTTLPYKNVNSFRYSAATTNPVTPFERTLDFFSANPVFNLQSHLKGWPSMSLNICPDQ